MRVLFAVAGGPSHLYPLVPLAWAFRTAGHEVRLAGTPKSAETMAYTGLSIVTVGHGPIQSAEARDELVTTAYGQPPWPTEWPVHPERLKPEQLKLLEVLGRYSVAVADAMADDLVAFARHWRPDLIVHDTLALCAELTGIPCVRYTHGTQDVFCVERRPSGEPLPEYVEMFARFGQEPPQGALFVDTMPTSMFLGAERPCVPMRWVPYNGPGLAPDGLTKSRPRVCVTWGMVVESALGTGAADPFIDTITAIARAGAEVVVLTSPSLVSALGAPAQGVRYISGAPLNLVLPHCDAIVHHGGEGTAMAAAALSVPHLVVTREPLDDQVGGRLAQTGAAIHLRHQELSGVRDAIDKLLSDPSYLEAAQRLREDIESMPAPADVVPQLIA